VSGPDPVPSVLHAAVAALRAGTLIVYPTETFYGIGAIAPWKALRLLDFLEHLEDAFRRTDEKALVGLAEAATLKGVPAGSGSFGHKHHLLLQRFAVSRKRILSATSAQRKAREGSLR
jgi:hypothetical protein